MCQNPKNDKGFDVKEFHNWRHVIGCRNENPDLSLEMYICEDCGAILLRKWGLKCIINKSSLSNCYATSETVSGGWEFNNRRMEWEKVWED